MEEDDTQHEPLVSMYTAAHVFPHACMHIAHISMHKNVHNRKLYRLQLVVTLNRKWKMGGWEGERGKCCSKLKLSDCYTTLFWIRNLKSTELCIIFYKLFFLQSFCVCREVGRTYVPQHVCGGQGIACLSWFLPSTMWVTGTELRFLGLATSTFTDWAISPALNCTFQVVKTIWKAAMKTDLRGVLTSQKFR